MAQPPSTRRVREQLIETDVAGRVTADMIGAMASDYRELGGRSTWLIAADRATSYAPEAIQRAVDDFAKLQREHGLERIVAIIGSPLVRMGATIVSASLRSIGSPLEIHVVADRASAEIAITPR